MEPWAYLNDVLPKLARLSEGEDVASLVPAAWKAARVAPSSLEPCDVADEAA